MAILIRNWWALALRGLAAIVFGLAALVVPGITLVVLIALFGAYALVDGIFALVAAVRAAERHQRWGPLLLEGVSGIVVGVLTFAWPGVTALILLYFIAAWAILTGLFALMGAVRLRREIDGEWLLGLTGLLSVVFGLLLVAFPGAGALTVVWLIGTYALIFGVLLVWLALRLRGWNQAGSRASHIFGRGAMQH
jgi:uncharacterized membrane protein HdeD (DUF308 family)